MIFKERGEGNHHLAFWRRAGKKLAISISVIVLIYITWSLVVRVFIENDDPYVAAPEGTQWADVGENRIAYQHIKADTGKSIIFIGGTTAWSGVWRYTIEALEGSYNLYAIDLPPFGYSVVGENHVYNLSSQADLINGYIDSMNLTDVILVAHSYGAGPSMEAVLREPDNFSKLVLIDGAVHVDRERNAAAFMQNLFSIQTFRYFLISLAVHFPGFMEASLKYLVYDNSSVDDFWVSVYKQPLSVAGQSKKLSNWFYDFAFENGTGLSSESKNYVNLQIPVAIIWGREDNLTPLAQGEYLQKIIPRNIFTVLDAMGHIPMIDDHDRYISVLQTELSK